MDLLILIICSLSIALLGLLILARNPTSADNRRFSLITVSLILWMVANYLSDNASAHNLFFTRLTFFGGISAVFSFLFFVSNFPARSVLGESLLLRIHTILTIALIPVVYTPFFISSVGLDRTNQGVIITSFLYPIFIFYLGYSLILLIRIARKQARAVTHYAQKQQVLLVFGGILIYAALAIMANVLVPLLIDNWSSSRFGPLFTLIFVALVAYAIVKRRLFDVKFIIFRSLGYVLSLLAIGLLSFISLKLLSLWLDNAGVSKGIQIDIFALLTLVLAVLYLPSKRIFDKLTNKLFYRDAYDPQKLINEFNQVIASTIILDRLLDHASTTIEKFIKPVFIQFVISGKASTAEHNMKRLSKELTNSLNAYFHNTAKPCVTDTLEESDIKLKRLLQNADIGMVARLSAGVAIDGGYIVLGYKKSGNVYNTQDVSTVNILANGLSLAVHNAAQFEEIQRFNSTLQERVNNATRKLRHTNEKLRQLDQTKDDFISMASHQLRTPLTSVKGYVSMVLDGDAGKLTKLQRKLLGQSFISAQRMVYLISDLLNVSRLRTGKFVIEPVPTNLAKIIKDEVDQLLETAKGRDLTLTFNKPEHFPTYLLDETKMRQVIMNFIDNAIYYTPAGGNITINLLDKPSTIELTVVDDGIGVPREEQHHLFTKFFRAHNAKRARPDGTGLGLFMAKKVVVAQGGAIIFKSQEHKGSTFGFTFAKDKLKSVPEK